MVPISVIGSLRWIPEIHGGLLDIPAWGSGETSSWREKLWGRPLTLAMDRQAFTGLMRMQALSEVLKVLVGLGQGPALSETCTARQVRSGPVGSPDAWSDLVRRDGRLLGGDRGGIPDRP